MLIFFHRTVRLSHLSLLNILIVELKKVTAFDYNRNAACKGNNYIFHLSVAEQQGSNESTAIVLCPFVFDFQI